MKIAVRHAGSASSIHSLLVRCVAARAGGRAASAGLLEDLADDAARLLPRRLSRGSNRSRERDAPPPVLLLILLHHGQLGGHQAESCTKKNYYGLLIS